MARAREVFALYGCAACGWRAWIRNHEDAPRHRCPHPGRMPAMWVALCQELGHPQSEGE